MKDSLPVKFLYQTVIGRFCLKVLTRPGFSKWAGKYLDSRASAWLVPLFIKKHNIDMQPYHDGPYVSFNDFFTRKRTLSQRCSADQLLSPCDGLLRIYNIEADTTFKIKHVQYDLNQLLRDPMLAERYANGFCFVFRLTPQHYHRYNYACSGAPSALRKIRGQLHCVRPIVYEDRAVYAENSRTYQIIHSPVYGDVIQMEVGALMVGKICNHSHQNEVICSQEKGYFAFGGSTIILLIQREKIVVDSKLNTAYFKEIAIFQNDLLGTAATGKEVKNDE